MLNVYFFDLIQHLNILSIISSLRGGLRVGITTAGSDPTFSLLFVSLDGQLGMTTIPMILVSGFIQNLFKEKVIIKYNQNIL